MPISPQQHLPIPQSEMRLEQTVRTSRKFVQSRRGDGVECPCCDQWVEEYRRSLNTGMAATLVALWAATNLREELGGLDPWFHVERELVKTGRSPCSSRDFSIMRFWGLIEPRPPKDPRAKKGAAGTGYWRITDDGRTACANPKHPFCRKYIVMYNDRPLRFEGPRISLVQALGKRFKMLDLVFKARQE